MLCGSQLDGRTGGDGNRSVTTHTAGTVPGSLSGGGGGEHARLAFAFCRATHRTAGSAAAAAGGGSSSGSGAPAGGSRGGAQSADAFAAWAAAQRQLQQGGGAAGPDVLSKFATSVTTRLSTMPPRRELSARDVELIELGGAAP